MTSEISRGATTVARLLAGGEAKTRDLEVLPEPWAAIARALASAAGPERARAFAAAISGLDGDRESLRDEVYAASAALDAPKTEDKPRRRKGRLGDRLSGEDAQRVAEIGAGLPSPDPLLREQIIYALTCTGVEKRPPVMIRRRNAGALLLQWLLEHGAFVRSIVGERYYLFRDKRRLFALDTDEFSAWLYALSGANPAGTDFAYLLADCRALAMEAPIREIARVAAWDAAADVLRVSRFDGTVFVLDGETIRQEANGEDGVIFVDSPFCTPYEPEFGEAGAVDWLTRQLPNWEGDGDLYGLVFWAWVLSTFFAELCPTRPLAVFCGEKGAGKSAAFRLLLSFLFGPSAQLAGIPDRPDGFTAAAAAEHILILDNLDVFTGWLRDKLARIASGADDHYRKLYSNNERGLVRYRCFVGITARTPDTLKRDDLADRILLLPVERIDDSKRLRETSLAASAGAMRGAFWGEVLTVLNQAVAQIRRGGLQNSRCALRMADWEALGRVFARLAGQEDLWDRATAQIQQDQSGFLLDDDLVVEGLALWMLNEANHGKEIMARELHAELGKLLFDDRKPPSDWPKSAVGFGRRLGSIRRDLGSLYDLDQSQGTETHNRGSAVYRFWPKGLMPTQETLFSDSEIRR